MSFSYRVFPYYQPTGASNTIITPGTGALSATGQAAHVRPIHVDAAALAITGQPASVRQNIRITPGTGSLSLTGQGATAASKSQIISAEYVGDGASSRSFSSFGFVPLCVIVIGKDGAGNVIGAIGHHEMVNGKSQPFLENVATSDSSRDNRIISFDANGFTVGPDLNVNGRNYAYIMFPDGRVGAVTHGSYVGNTVTAPGHASLIVQATRVDGNPGGSTQFVKPQYCVSTWYRPAGSTPYTPGTPLILGGRRMIRDSDGAVLAEATEYINDSACFAVGYIIGNESIWHWEDQYIELHTLVPDLVLIMADDATGQAVPATIAPPPTNTTIGWSLNSIGAPVFFASNTEAVLHIPDTNGLSYNLDGKLYQWVALKGDELGSGGVLMKTFQYTGTGDGPYPIDLVGCGFDPEWAFLQRAGDQFHWSKRTRNILGAHTSRRWQDGSGDHIFTNPAYTVDFITDGIEFPATNSAWNVLGTEYTVTLIGISGPVAQPPNTGELTLVGYQPTLRITTRIIPNTGELHLTGKQPTVTPNFTRITPGTGSLIATAHNPVVARKTVIIPGTGSLAASGQLSTVGASGRITPSPGALSFVGQQPVLRQTIFITPGSGALAAAGQRCFTQPPDFLIIPQTGALAITGQQARRSVTITPGTGALGLTGYAVLPHLSFPTRITPGSGSLVVTGRQPILDVSLIPHTGELLVSTFNTEPILEREITTTFITPGAGHMGLLGSEGPGVVIPIITYITPGTGSMGGGVCQCNFPITPNTGALGIVGQPVIVQVTIVPIPQVAKPQPSGGVGLPHPRKLPFWPKRILVARGKIIEPAATFSGRGHCEENELAFFGGPPSDGIG